MLAFTFGDGRPCSLHTGGVRRDFLIQQRRPAASRPYRRSVVYMQSPVFHRQQRSSSRRLARCLRALAGRSDGGAPSVHAGDRARAALTVGPVLHDELEKTSESILPDVSATGQQPPPRFAADLRQVTRNGQLPVLVRDGLVLKVSNVVPLKRFSCPCFA